MVPHYLLFHAVFVLPVVAALSVAGIRTASRDDVVGLTILLAAALVYTVPWDGLMIRRGVWRYGPRSIAATVWRVPVGEYLFIILQPVLTGLWTLRVDSAPGVAGRQSVGRRIVGVLAGLTVCIGGLLLLATLDTFYLGAILAWAGPVLAIQWGFGWSYLWQRRRTVLVSVLVPTAYLCFADRLAIHYGIWRLVPGYTTGFTVAGLPIEEATFFLVTNLFVVQGLVLFRGVAVDLRAWASSVKPLDEISY